MTIVSLVALAIPSLANAQSVPLPADGATQAFGPATGTLEEKSALRIEKSIDRLKDKMSEE